MKTKKKFPTKNISSQKKQNPFEVHVNRSKYEVLGRKLKSEHGLPGVSKHKAIQKRKTTLLQEYKWKDKANQFIDSRIGERNSAMTEDDRIMARFAAERKKMYNKKTMFNLSETEVLTHRGQTLSEIEKFEDVRSDDDDPDETGALRGKFVSNAHFGGGVLSQGKQDRESIINQLIIESNKRIAERKRNKEQTLEATEQLDEEWKTLGTIVTAKPKDDDANARKNDKYDIVMRQFKFEPQAQATQRLKTDEEVAKEERDKLEKLEKERLKQLREIEAAKYGNHRSADDLDDGFSNLLEVYREDVSGNKSESGSDESGEESDNEGDHNEMEQDGEEEEGNFDDSYNDGSDDDDDDDDNSGSDNSVSEKLDYSVEFNEGKNKIKEVKDKNKTKHLKADDTSSVLPSKKGKSIKTTDAIEPMETSNNDGSEKSDSESSEEEDAMQDLTDLMPPVEEKNKKKKLKKQSESQIPVALKEGDVKENTKQKKKLKLDLPYVINVPDDFDLFKQLLSTHSAEEQDVIFERIIKSNHPNLKPENKRKMLCLAEYVLELLDKQSVSWPTILVLVKHWMTLKEFNTKECLLALVDSIKSKVDIFEADDSEGCPELDCAIRFLVWYSLLVSQPRGVEVLLPLGRPVMSIVCKHLSRTLPRHWADAPVCLLLCRMLLKDAEKSSTLYTEGVSFLHRCVKKSIKCEGCRKQRLGRLCKCDSNETDERFRNASDKDLTFSFDGSFLDGLETADPRILYFAVVILSGFVRAYRKFPQCKILFKPIHATVNKLNVQNFAPPLKKAITDLQELLQVLQKAEIPVLMKTSKKPKALRQYEPSFYTVTTSKTHRGLPAEKQEEQKLLHKYKHEMKGAMRELRRDRQFLANIKLREQVQSDEQRIRKVKEIFGSAANQQGELRRMKRKK